MADGRKAKPPRPDRRRDRTRQALLKAGRSLLATREVESLSVDEIVAAADVAKGSFYNHFPDKDVFAREIGAQVRSQVETAIAEANLGITDAAQHMARAVCVVVRFAIEHRDSAAVLWRLNSGSTLADAPINSGVRAAIERGIENERFRYVDLNSGILLTIGVIVITVRHVLEDRAVRAPADIAQLMTAGLLRSLGLSPAQATSVARNAVNDVLQSPLKSLA